jgi:lipoate---protein ligase
MSEREERWRLVPPADGSIDGELAAAEGMLAGLAQTARPTMRWYRSSVSGLVLGAGQPPGDVNRSELAEQQLTLHRRASGGGAVLWTPELWMLDIALPLNHPLALHDVSRSYEWLGRVWQLVLRDLGIVGQPVSIAAARADRAQLSPQLQRVCFAGLSPAEVTVAGRKLVGFAQIRRKHGFLFQVGVYQHWPNALMGALLGAGTVSSEFAAQLSNRVTALDQLGATLTFDELQQLFAARLIEYGVVGLDADAWRTDELAAAAQLRTRFRALSMETDG